MQKQKVTTGTHMTIEEDSQVVESSLVEEADEFLDEIDKILERQDALAGFRQRGGE